MDSAPLPGHVIICGLGNIGCRVAALCCRLGLSGRIISLGTGENWYRNGTESFTVITGNARDEALLREAGITEASVLFALTDDDVANVDISLVARRLNPNITVIARTQDDDLAEHLERSGLVHRAFCTASLAVPAFTAAARSSNHVDTLESEGRQLDLEHHVLHANSPGLGLPLSAWETGTGNRIFALRHKDGATVQPDPALLLVAGMTLHYLKPRPSEPSRPDSPRLQALHRLSLGLRNSWSEVPRAFRIALGAIGCILLLSVALFHVALNLPWIDSLYFVCTTVTTVGYGDINLMSAAPWLKLYGSFLMLCSAGLLATVCSIITNLLLQTRLRDVLSRGCSDQRDHLVVAGLGNVGYRLVSSLVAAGEKVVAIEDDRSGRYVEEVKRLAPVIHGDARLPTTLARAGISGAKALVAVTSEDIENLAIGLASKRQAPSGRVILRLFDSKLAASMGKGPQVDTLLSVSTVAAPSLIAAGLRRDALKGLILDDLLIVFYPLATTAATATSSGLGIEWHSLRPVPTTAS